MAVHAHSIPAVSDLRTRRSSAWSLPSTSHVEHRLHDLAAVANGSPLQRAQGVAENLSREGDRPNRTGLPDRLKQGIESLSGLTMDDVRVHRNSPGPSRVGALAYAQGTDIHLSPGEDRHLPHEAWHVVQQKQGRVRTTGWIGTSPLNADPALEREATEMGQAANGVLVANAIQRMAKTVHLSPDGRAPIQRVDDEVDTEPSHAEGERDQEEWLERGDLVLAEIPDFQWSTIGSGLASYHHQAYRAFVDLRAVRERGLQRDFGLFLQWFNRGVMTRSGVRTMVEEHLQQTVDPSAESGDDVEPMQQRASSHTESGPKSYQSSISGPFTGASYMRDGVGTIDFGKLHQGTGGQSPIYGGVVDLETGAMKPGYGITLNGTKIRLPGASRGNHFSVANRIVNNGFGQSSPTDKTWHHLVTPYKMVLVDRVVHAKHNHNGGNLLWT